MPFLFSAHVKSRPGSCHKRGWFWAGRGRNVGRGVRVVRNDRENKIGLPCRIALVGAFATTAGIGEITLKRTGQYFDRLLILRRRFGTIKQTQVK
jgi:hypothetical protein